MTTEPHDDGGGAFPAMLPGCNYCTPGMTLRDWFAGQALAGMLMNPKETGVRPSTFARCAFDFADAMLRQRGPVE